jgi:hypothetical protein
MRLYPSKEAFENSPHDRFMIGRDITFNLPSFTTILKGGRESEILETNNEFPFLEFWNNKELLDISNNWSKIKEILDQGKTFKSNCTFCGKVAYPPFNPQDYPNRIIFCIECKGKRYY